MPNQRWFRLRRSGGSRTAAHGGRGARGLAFEHLESRRLFALLQVGAGAAFASIQSAVDAARPGDIIQVGDGQYAESVDLSRMGIVRGGPVGNLTIRSSSPGAIVRPPTGQAAFFNSAAFAGDLDFSGLTLSGSGAGVGTRGMDLSQVNGDLTAAEIVFEGLTDAAIGLAEVTGDLWLQSNLFEGVGDSSSDATIRVAQFRGAAVITGNDFEGVHGAVLDLANGGDTESTWLVDDNLIVGDRVLFATTVTGVRAHLSGHSRTDLTLVDTSFDGLAGSAIDCAVQDQAELQTRWSTNTISSLQGPAGAQVALTGSAVGALLSDTNSWDQLFGSGLSLRVAEAARLQATVQYDAFTSIGDGQGAEADDAVRVTTATDATGRLDLFLFNNTVSTVAGSGLRISADGSASLRAVIAENVLDETNSATSGSAVLVEHASAASQANVELRVEGNSVYRNEGDAYRLRQQGSGAMRLERPVGVTAAAHVAAQNAGAPVAVIGAVGAVVPGYLDPTLPLSLGDMAWWDNGDSLQNPGEQGVGGVVLRLTGTETVGGAAVNRLTQTDASGRYLFPGLAAGQYTLTLEVPFAVRLATANQGTDDAADSDFDANTHRASVVLVGPNDLTTVDAGLWRTWQNPASPLDVNGDGTVFPLDVLVLINDLNARGSRALPVPPAPSATPPYLDVSGDGAVGPQDALIVINYLNKSSAAGGEGEADVTWFAAPSDVAGRVSGSVCKPDREAPGQLALPVLRRSIRASAREPSFPSPRLAADDRDPWLVDLAWATELADSIAAWL